MSAPDATGPGFDREWQLRFERFGRSQTAEHAVSGWSAEGLRRRVKLFRAIVGELGLAPGARALELGCGPGTYVRDLARRGHRVTGMDYAWPSLRRAVEMDAGAGGRYVAGDGYELPFAAASFDLVTCIGVLQAVAGPERLLDEIARVLRPGGLVLVETLNGRGLPAASRRTRELLAGLPPRLRTYGPAAVGRWLAGRDIQALRRYGVYVPPRHRSALARLLDRRGVVPALERIPGAARLVAHAFWTIGRKGADVSPRPAPAERWA